jgi:periplasmic protein TonB
MHLIYKPLFMEPNQIKEAHILDILFDGRNKEYGAYELRMTYNRRVVKAMIVMGSVVILAFVGSAVSGLGKAKRGARIDVGGDVILEKVIDPPPPVPPPPRVVLPPQVATVRITTFKIVPDEQVKKSEEPPENDAADHMQIGTVNKAGVEDGDIVGPPASSGMAAGVVEAPKKQDPNEIFLIVEIDASFPGGMPAWARFLNKNLRYPDEAMNIGINGTVVVQFVVDLEGNVSDVKAISGPDTGGLREEAERVIKKSGKWVPAIQNGRHVKAYRRQPVTFKSVQDN